MGWKQTINEFRANRLDELRDICAAFEDVCRWIERGLRQHFAMFASDFKALFAPLDPKRFATTPPEFWNETVKGGAKEVPKTGRPNGTELRDLQGVLRAFAPDLMHVKTEDVPDNYFEAEVLWDAVAINATSGEVKITPSEWWEMQNYSKKQRLSNLELAKEIKRHWLLGKTSGQIAADMKLKPDLVKKYVACFTRAEKHSPAETNDKTE